MRDKYWSETRLNNSYWGLSVFSRREVGRKEGRKRGREREKARQRGDELFEAERVVKLRLIQAKEGKTRQWKCQREFGLGQLQVGANCHIYGENDTIFLCHCVCCIGRHLNAIVSL